MLAHAETMTVTEPAAVTEMVASLRAQLGEAALVELTAVIAFAELRHARTSRSALNRMVSLRYSGSSRWPIPPRGVADVTSDCWLSLRGRSRN